MLILHYKSHYWHDGFHRNLFERYISARWIRHPKQSRCGDIMCAVEVMEEVRQWLTSFSFLYARCNFWMNGFWDDFTNNNHIFILRSKVKRRYFWWFLGSFQCYIIFMRNIFSSALVMHLSVSVVEEVALKQVLKTDKICLYSFLDCSEMSCPCLNVKYMHVYKFVPQKPFWGRTLQMGPALHFLASCMSNVYTCRYQLNQWIKWEGGREA